MTTRWRYRGESLGPKHCFPGVRNPPALVQRVDDRVAHGNTRKEPPHTPKSGGAHAVRKQCLPHGLRCVYARGSTNGRCDPTSVRTARREANETDELAVRYGHERRTLFAQDWQSGREVEHPGPRL